MSSSGSSASKPTYLAARMRALRSTGSSGEVADPGAHPGAPGQVAADMRAAEADLTTAPRRHRLRRLPDVLIGPIKRSLDRKVERSVRELAPDLTVHPRLARLEQRLDALTDDLVRLAATRMPARESTRQAPAGAPLLIIGGGGHAGVVIDVARAAGWSPAGILDPAPVAPTLLDVPVIGDDSDLQRLHAEGWAHACIAIGRNDLRLRLGRRARAAGFALPTLIHPSAEISPAARLGAGVTVMPKAVINAGATIGDFAIVNTGAIVEHDCQVGAGSHVAPRSVMGGRCRIGEGVLIGIGAVLRPESVVADDAIVGAGAVVAAPVDPGAVVTGVPAKPSDQSRRA